jgi:hypothetical protein
MESPPPYKKKSNTGLIVGIVIGAVLLCCVVPGALMLGGGLFLFGKVKGIATCGMAYDDMGKALTQYAGAHNGKLPNAKTWQNDLRPYYEKISAQRPREAGIEIMSATGDWSCKNDGVTTGFAFNTDVSGKAITALKDPDTVVIFEQPKVAANLAMTYKAPDFASSPKMFNENRGWLVVTATGQSGIIGKGGKMSDMDIDTGSGFKVETKVGE